MEENVTRSANVRSSERGGNPPNADLANPSISDSTKSTNLRSQIHLDSHPFGGGGFGQNESEI